MNGQPQTTPVSNLSFAAILYYLNQGDMIAREGWNGNNQFVYKTVGNTVSKDFIPKFASLPASVKKFLESRGQDVVFNSSFTLYNAQGTMQPGWIPSQGDLQANDWYIIKL